MNNEIRNNRKLKGVRIMLWYTVKDFWKCFLVLSWKLPWKNPIFRENFLKLFIKCSCYFYVTFQEFFTKLFKTFFLKSGVFLGINFSWIFLETFQEIFMATKWSTLQEYTVHQNLATKFLLCSFRVGTYLSIVKNFLRSFMIATIL